MQLLSKAIHEILTTDTDITDTIGTGNIWHSRIPQRTTSGTDTPPDISIYYYVYAVNPNPTKTGRSNVDEHMLRVNVVGRDDESMYEVARYVRYALDRITPGEYGGIPIQGIDFLNAGFDPEGNYELEYQSWMLEFKVRVIDNDIRVPGGTPAEFSSPLWWYSTDEQVWPYNKWLNGETIYWRTWGPLETGSTEDVYLTGLLVSEVAQIVKYERILYGTNKDKWITEGGGLTPEESPSDTFKTSVESTDQDHYVTVWYTKT